MKEAFNVGEPAKRITRLFGQANSILAERDFESSLLEKHLHFCANVGGGEILPLFAFLVGHVAQVACVLIDKPAYSPDNNAWLQTACHPWHREYSM